MISLLKPLLPELAGHHCAAVCIHSVGEVLAGEADPSSLPSLQLFFVDVLPLIHARILISTNVLNWLVGSGQEVAADFLAGFCSLL